MTDNNRRLDPARARVRALYNDMEATPAAGMGAVLRRHTGPDYLWRGMHPFHEQRTPEAVDAVFWQPFLNAFSRVQRREDIFIAGLNEIDGFESVWVVSMGHLLALFDAPWLGIRPTRKLAFLRYAEFHRIEADRIRETAFFFDIPHIMAQAGQYPFPPQTAAHIVAPGPRTHDGIITRARPPAEGQATLALINRMIDDINSHRSMDPREELARNWTQDMLWYGPTGIGATYTIDRYIAQHQQPFRVHLADRVFNGHLARLAEGHFGGFFGWANLTLRNTGGFMGMPAGPGPADMRVVDLYRREGNRLAENWVFIDLLHFLHMQGLNTLGPVSGLT